MRFSSHTHLWDLHPSWYRAAPRPPACFPSPAQQCPLRPLHRQPLSWFSAIDRFCRFQNLYAKGIIQYAPFVSGFFYSISWYSGPCTCCVCPKLFFLSSIPLWRSSHFVYSFSGGWTFELFLICCYSSCWGQGWEKRKQQGKIFWNVIFGEYSA